MCAIFGIWNHEEASKITYLGLYALQHRGQESSGIVSVQDNKHLEHKGFGSKKTRGTIGSRS
jgi:amidophosphoribosyltransferase